MMFKKIFVIVLLCGIGLLIAGLVLAEGDWDNIRSVFISDDDYTAAEVSGTDVFKSVEMDLIDHRVYFYHSEDETYKINYFESNYDKVEVKVVGDVLKIVGESKPRVRFFNWRFKSDEVSRLNVYLPKSFKGQIDASVISGEINIHEFNLSKLILDVTSGEINITNTIVDTSIQSDVTSGEVNLNHVTATLLDLKATSGEIEVRNSNIQSDFKIKVTSGDINVELCTAKTITASATSGKVVLKNITTDGVNGSVQSGRIDILLEGAKSEYEVDVNITSGNFYYLGNKESDRRINRGAPKSIRVSASSGTIKVNFN